MTPPAGDPLTLSAEEADAVVDAARAFAAALPAERATPYTALADIAAGREVPADQIEPLTRVCELALSTGKARALGRAEAERLLVAVLRRTPAGKQALAAVSEINAALAGLAGKPLAGAKLVWRLPGHYYLQLAVAGVDLTLAIEPDGVRVQSLHAG